MAAENSTMKKQMRAVYVIARNGEKARWTRVGVAFENSDGSWNIKLDAVPVNGELHVRDFSPREEEQSDSGGAEHPQHGRGASPGRPAAAGRA